MALTFWYSNRRYAHNWNMEEKLEALTAVFQANEPELRIVDAEEHFICRLYWPVEGISPVWKPAEQLTLIGLESMQLPN